MAEKVNRDTLPDIQNSIDSRGKAIERVGVENVIVPLQIARKTSEDILSTAVQAKVSMYIGIGKEITGANMSRFIQTLMFYDSQVLSSVSLKDMMNRMRLKLGSTDGYIRLEFKYFVERFAPVSKTRAVQGYDCAFIGKMDEQNKYTFVTEVNVVGTTLCPCSKEISNYGAHNQRNHTRVRIVPTGNFYWLEDIIDLIESQYSCPIFPVLKREDEKWVTETAYENPKFVEDISRDIAIALDSQNVMHYHIRTSADESIHQHQAVAILQKDWVLA